jgi:zinc D-Ala-D-Ala carboxypeptidase
MGNRLRLVGIGFAATFAIVASTVGATGASASARPHEVSDACDYTSAETTVASGSRGAAVSQAQCELNAAYSQIRSDILTVDGDFGPATKATTRAFQSCVGIPADGVIGPQTWRELDSWAVSIYFACE